VAAALTLPDGFNLALQSRTQGAVVMTAALVVMLIWSVRRGRAADDPAPAGPADQQADLDHLR
jgi:hypothetical protein